MDGYNPRSRPSLALSRMKHDGDGATGAWCVSCRAVTKRKGEHLDAWVLICRRRCSASKCNTALVNPPASLVKRFPTGLPHVSGGYETKQYLGWDGFACLSGVLDKTDKFPRRLHVREGRRETLNSA